VGPRAILDAEVKRKIPSPAGSRTLEPRSYKCPTLYRPIYHGMFMIPGNLKIVVNKKKYLLSIWKLMQLNTGHHI
jgi:hypothetical protein